MKKPRHLSKAERDIWERVARTATPLDPQPKRPLPGPAPAAPRNAHDPIAPFDVGSRAQTTQPDDIRPSVTQQLRNAPVTMDAKRFGKMTRGKVKPEARIDLHGMTLDQAHPALTRFILTAVDRERRLVLVITGKGQEAASHAPYPQQRGILRRQVPQWLGVPPLAPHILEVRPAHRRHGGDGAYYVYLRRHR